MTDIDALKRYFDILMSGGGGSYNPADPMAVDEVRFALYDDMKGDFKQISRNLGQISTNLEKTYPDYRDMTQNLAGSFKDLSNISHQDLDFCVRTIAVERLVYSREHMGQMTPEMLGYLVEALMSFFFEQGDQIMRSTKKTLLTLKDQKQRLFFKKKEEEELRAFILNTLGLYEEVETDLLKAKNGIMIKDRKMLEVLQHIRVDLGKGLIQAAAEKSQKEREDRNIAQMIINKAKDRLLPPGGGGRGV